VTVHAPTVILDFFLNYHLFDKFDEHDKARLNFYNCHKYSFNTMNDEGYYRGQYRFKPSILPWGEFYRLDTNWKIDFPDNSITLIKIPNEKKQKHYIFFFKDNTFECVAEGYQLTLYRETYV